MNKTNSRFARRKPGPKKGCSYLNWSEVDWRQSDEKIAKKMRCCEQTVRNQRKKHDKNKSWVPPRKRGIRWDRANWNYSNVDIAAKLGCSHSTVSLKRLERGLPPGTKVYLRSRWPTLDWSKSDHKLAKRLQCSRMTVRKHRQEFAPHTISNKSVNWAEVDWSLSNRELAVLLNRAPSWVNNRRKFFDKPSEIR